jgi:hypothetical protein
MLCVATLAVGQIAQRGVLEEFSTQLAVLHPVITSPDLLTSLDFADKPPTVSTLYAVGLNSSPCRCNRCAQIFHTTLSDRIRGWKNLFELPSEFSLNSYDTFR